MSVKLPVVGSTAATTAFCSARLDGLGDFSLYFDGNGKVTADNGTLLEPKPNAFSLPAAGLSGDEHCPQATATCKKACYVEGLSRAQPDLYALYEHNARTIREILMNRELADWWALHVAHWITQNAAGGFRIHVSGDFFSLEYAQWWADVARECAPVLVWTYTRSFDFVTPLVEASTLHGGNLALSLSCDRDNFERAVQLSKQHAHRGREVRLAYLTTDGSLPRGKRGESLLYADDVVFPDYNLRPRQFATLAESPWWQSISKDERGLVCPVDAHSKAENRRCGPCKRCMT